MPSQWQGRPQHQCIDQKPTGPAIISPPSSGSCKTRRAINRESGRIVFGHFQEHFSSLPCQGFHGCLVKENTRKPQSARFRYGADAENFRLLGRDLDENEGLRFSRRRILGRKRENALPRQQGPKRCLVPCIRETLAMKRCKQRGIGAGCNAARCAHGAMPGSFASGGRR